MNLMDAMLEIANSKGDVNGVQMLLSFRGQGRVTADGMKVGGSWISFSEPIPVNMIAAPHSQQSHETTESGVSSTQPILKKKPSRANNIPKVPGSQGPLRGGARVQPASTKKVKWADQQLGEQAPHQKTHCLPAVDRSPPRICDSRSNRKARVMQPTPIVEEIIILEDGSSSVIPQGAESGRSMPRLVHPRRVTKTPGNHATARGVKKAVPSRGVKRPAATQ